MQQRQLWHGLKIVDVALTEAMQRNDDESLRRWLHLLTQMSGAYSKLVKTTELDEKLRAVESFILSRILKHEQALEILYFPESIRPLRA